MEPPPQKKLVLFGAGKIGRSFIARLFSSSGYEVVFVDINHQLVQSLNTTGMYNIIIKDEKPEVITIQNVRALHVSHKADIIREILDCSLVAISVGYDGIRQVTELIAEAGLARFRSRKPPLDVIIAENMRDASSFLLKILKEKLPSSFPTEDFFGLAETSIGKMVPLAQPVLSEERPADIFAEAYNELIVDKSAFKNPVPRVPGLLPKENIKAWVDRKFFIHNFGHAALAYLTFVKKPDLIYTREALEDPEISQKVLLCMKQAAAIFMSIHPGEFCPEELDEHIADLLKRFSNKALKDSILRVGLGLHRKLGPDDRIVPLIRQGIERNLPYDLILEVLVSGIWFSPANNKHSGDNEFLHKFNHDLYKILQDHCKFDFSRYPGLFDKARETEQKVKKYISSNDKKRYHQKN